MFLSTSTILQQILVLAHPMNESEIFDRQHDCYICPKYLTSDVQELIFLKTDDVIALEMIDDAMHDVFRRGQKPIASNHPYTKRLYETMVLHGERVVDSRKRFYWILRLGEKISLKRKIGEGMPKKHGKEDCEKAHSFLSGIGALESLSG